MASPKPYTANLPAEFFWSLGEPEIIYWQIFDVDNNLSLHHRYYSPHLNGIAVR
jgi:hypothetical protein